MAINMAIGDEPMKLRMVYDVVPLTNQILAMVVKIMMKAGINGTKIEVLNDGRLFSSIGLSDFRNVGIGRSRLPKNFGKISPAQITEGIATRTP